MSALPSVREAHIGAPLCTEDEGEDDGLRPASREKDLPSPINETGSPANRAASEEPRADKARAATIDAARLAGEIGHNANRVPVLMGPRIAVGK
jgi:hypothetical protein